MRRRTGNIKQRGPDSFRIRYHDATGVRQAETIRGTREDAERELAIRLGDLAQGKPVSSAPHTVTFAELANDVVTDYEVNGLRSVDDIEARFRLHLIPVFGDRKASQIMTADIQAYIVNRQKEGAANGAINRELEAFRRAYCLGIKGRKIYARPHIPMLREVNVRAGFFTAEEVERLAAALPPTLAAMVRFAFMTGWRLEEIRQLTWAQVDFARNEIRLHVGTTKNRDGRVFPLNSALRALLQELKPATLRVFPVGEFRKTWKTACHKANIPGTVVAPVNKGGKPGAVKVIKAGRTFHDLRRSFAREMSNRGVREGAIMKLAGWKTRSVFDRYNIVSDADLRDAVQLMDKNHAGRSDAR